MRKIKEDVHIKMLEKCIHQTNMELNSVAPIKWGGVSLDGNR